jgi:hypothetical protein
LFKEGDGAANAFFKVYVWFPLQGVVGAGNIWLPALRVARATSVFKDDPRCIARDLVDRFSELQYGHFHWIADVDGEMFLGIKQFYNAIYEIIYKTK